MEKLQTILFVYEMFGLMISAIIVIALADGEFKVDTVGKLLAAIILAPCIIQVVVILGVFYILDTYIFSIPLRRSK